MNSPFVDFAGNFSHFGHFRFLGTYPIQPKMNEGTDEVDLYEILELSRGASKAEIKKAYHKAALSNHPDKVHADDRDEAELKFKVISQAYEILYDDEKREMYDMYGMEAFDRSRNGMPGDSTAEDLFAQFFGAMGGMPPSFGGGAGPRHPQRGKDEHQNYNITLQELYKGKSARFSSTKKVVCGNCKGSGGKKGRKATTCGICHGRGSQFVLRAGIPGTMMREVVDCSSCKATGKIFKDKDKCKKCKGKMIVSERKLLELYIPRGSKHGERIVLPGEADQLPDQQPGDIIFTLVQTEHPIFKREGSDLAAKIQVTLAEALCGFSRVVIKHLDGRGLLISHQKPKGGVLRPGQVIKVVGEGMPYRKSDLRGDLYLIVDIVFPDDEWLRDKKITSQLQKILPPPRTPIDAETVDEVEHDDTAKIPDFGPSDSGQEWVDVDEDDQAGSHTQYAHCAQQ